MAFGGSIKLEGETEYKKALASIMQTYKELQSELKLVTSQYDKNDKSQDALKAKAEAMNKLLEQQKAKLDLLNDRYAELNKLAEQQRSNIQSLTEKYRSEVSTLEELERSVGKSSDEYKKQESVVRDLENQLDKETKANEQTETAMSKLRVEMNNTQTEANKTGREMDNLGNETEEAGKDAEKAASGGWTILNGVIANLATNAIQKAIEGVKNLASKLVDVGKQSYNAFAEYEQLVGGVETLYGDSAGRLQEYAKNAYKTAGVSANKYMEQATSFAATLLQGLDGDTEKAVDYADMAIKDMADNANKMGTSLQSIQNAYQGFAKDNYTMLDNLKLGYGGTASEMARLVNDMKVLGVNEKGELLKEVNSETIKNVGMDKLIEAIHLAQQQLGITGTTAKEAEGTITGSMGQVAAAFENLKVAFATGDGGEVRGWVETLTLTLETMLKNAIPRIENVIKGMWTGIKTALRKNLPGVANSIIPIVEKIKKTVKTLFDFIIKNGDAIIAIIKGIVAALMAAKIADMIGNITTAVKGFLASSSGIGLLVGSFAALTGVLVTLYEAGKETNGEMEQMKANISETTDKLNDQADAWEDVKKEQEKYADTEMAKHSYYESLWEDLKKITDENGKIKEGYEARAEFIRTELSDAYGIEIQIVDGVIQEYDKLKDTMAAIIQQQRASVILGAQKSIYEEALGSRDERQKALHEAEADVEEIQAFIKEREDLIEELKKGNIQAYVDFYEDLPMEEGSQPSADFLIQMVKDELADAPAILREYQAAYDRARTALDESYYYIGLYESNFEKMQEGHYDELLTAGWKFTGEIAKTDEARINELKENYKQTKAEYDRLEKLYEDTNDDIYKAAMSILETETNSYRARLEELGIFVDGVNGLYTLLPGANGISLPSAGVLSNNMFSPVFNAMANMIQTALNGTKVEMDGEEMGKFVTNTITREVYSSVK